MVCTCGYKVGLPLWLYRFVYVHLRLYSGVTLVAILMSCTCGYLVAIQLYLAVTIQVCSLVIVNLWLYSVQVCLQMAIQVCSASGNTVSFPPLVAIQVFLQPTSGYKVYPLVAILYHSFHLWLYRCFYKWYIHLWLYCTIPSTCGYIGVPKSGYTSVSTCGFTGIPTSS